MSKSTQRVCIAAVAAALQIPYVANAAAPSDLAQLDFFEKKIRPVLAKECYECHSAGAKKLKGGLYLDTAEGMLKGGDSGPALVPGKPDKSLFLQTMEHTCKDEDLFMPPKKDKLSDDVIADFQKWVKMGAPDPRDGKTTRRNAWDENTAKTHWAFQKIANPPVPKPADPKHFIQNPIDAFVLAKLAEKKLAPSQKADKHTLIRRVTYDLTGLPPTPAEVDAFLTDNSPNALEKVVDRLLASPRYGERWGRHWLDISRYADTNGDRANGRRQPLYPYAWTYRDYVIDAFNKDLPYDQFVTEQIAADKLPESKSEKQKLAALGFLTVGKRFMGNDNDVIDDRIDVVTKGIMGITGACARCHDHKFDPIPTKEYYSMYGIFSSSMEPEEKPLIADPERNPHYKEFQAEVAQVDKDLEHFRERESARLLTGMLEKAGDYLLAVHETESSNDKSKKGDNFRKAARDRGLTAEIAALWKLRLTDIAKEKDKDPIFNAWFRYAALDAKSFAEQAKALTAELSAPEAKTHPLIVKELASHAPASMKEVSEAYTKVFDQLRSEMKLGPFVVGKGGVRSGEKFDVTKVKTSLADSTLESLRSAIFADNSPLMPSERNMQSVLGVAYSTAEGNIRNKVANLELTHPGAPVRAMAFVDRDKPRDAAVLIRGEPQNRGPVVPRAFPAVLSGGTSKTFTDGSGRLEMAKVITSRDNPLTARVIVNRVWQWHFGQALVRTVSDFGTRSDAPTHPQMLDYLATWLMDNGWSLKKLHKLIILSSTYQQDSRPNAAGMAADPTNQWLWRANIQRLDFEQVRDTLLNIGGKLDLTMGGQPFSMAVSGPASKGRYATVDLSSKNSNRRSVYAFIDRSALPEMLNTFDFANPDMSTGERIMTTVPQQALFMMNSPFLVEQVKNFLARPDFPAKASDAEKVKYIFRTVFQRSPSPAELKLAEDFLASETPAAPTSETQGIAIGKAAEIESKLRKKNGDAQFQPLTPLQRYTQIILLTNELIFLN